MYLHKSRRAFTLVELLVVIAIIGILVALLLPAVQAAREAARRSQCSNNVKQVVLALHNYHDTYKSFPSGVHWPNNLDTDGNFDDSSTSNEASWGWSIMVLPFIEQQAVYDEISGYTNRFSTQPANGDAMRAWGGERVISGFLCPSDRMLKTNNLRERMGKSNYVGIAGSVVSTSDNNYACADNVRGPTTGIFWCNSACRMGDITDGTSNTVMIGERDGTNTPGISPRRAAVWSYLRRARWLNAVLGATDGSRSAMLLNSSVNNGQAQWNSLGSLHPGGAQFGLADGSVRFIGETIDNNLYSAIGTRAGHEVAQID